MGSICSTDVIHRSAPSQSSTEITLRSKNSVISHEGDLVFSPGLFVKENSRSFYSAYTLETEPLGSGRNGEVRKCVHKLSQDTRVVKIISKASLPIEVIQSRSVFNEVEMLKAVDHPNLPRVYEFFEDDTNFFIVLEFCKGGDLFDRVVEVSSFTEPQAAEIMTQILSGVTYLHGKKIVHRDLKLENILLEEKNTLNIKIIDFDTATFFGLGYYNDMYGTPLYMAPEVVKGKYTEKCDLWSCGIMLYILLKGKFPYDGSDEEIFALLPRVKFNFSEEFAGYSQDLQDFLKKLLEKDPNKRISAAEACSHAWIKTYSKEISTKDISKVLLRMKSYRKTTKLKEAIHTFIISKIMDPKLFKTEESVFHHLDVNKDGIISSKEITDLLKQEMPTEEAEMYSNMIMEHADSDKNGYIDYTEFLRATIKNKKVCTRENIMSAFNYFDEDKNGTIEIEELRSALCEDGKTITQELINDIMKEADLNGDGKIDVNEFENLLVEALVGGTKE